MSPGYSSKDLSRVSLSGLGWTLAVVAVLGITASVVIALVVQSREQRLLEVQLDHRSHDRMAAIEIDLQTKVTHVRSIANLFSASTSVTREEFRTFATSILEHQPAIQALGYDALVTREGRPAHEARTRRGDYPDYRITERAADGSLVPAADRPEYVAVTFLEPLAGNEAALGFDIASGPARRETLELARDSGQPAISEAIVLVQEPGDQLGVLICVPLYSGTTPATVRERRERLHGYAVGVVRIGDLVSHALAGLQPAGLHLRVSDDSAPEGRRLLHLHHSRTLPSEADEPLGADFLTAHTRTHGFDIAGRRWFIEATPTRAFGADRTTWAPVGVLLTGLLATLTMVVYLVRQAAAGARLRSALLARDRAEERRAGLGRVLDESNEEIYVFDAESLRYRHVNRGARANAGYSMEDLRSMTPLDLKPGLTVDSFSALLEPLRDGARDTVRFTTVHRRKDGSRYDVEVHLQMTSFDGVPAFVAVIQDISDRKHLEARQRQSQKLEALGTLAGGTAHDVNNLLTAIMGYTELSLAELPPDGKTRGYLGEVLKASERARDVVRQILTFSRPRPIESRPIDLSDVIRDALSLIRSSLPATILIDENLVDGCFIRGDSSQIHQVLMNLCTNAAYAMRGEGGTLAVSVGTVELSAAEAAHLGDMSSGEYARLQVRDDGTGIRPEIRERIFDPFFTTKEQGEGTGMGLSVAHGIVKGHDGSMHAASEVGRGTVFSVYLPRIESLAVDSPDVTAAPVARGEHIIVVDDEPSITELMVQMLSASGYAVEAHEDGSAALEVIRRHPGKFDLVITDYSMPRMSGTTLAREIDLLFPDLPVILISGYGDLIDRDEVRKSGIRELLTKPIRQRDLESAIRRALDRASSPSPPVPSAAKS